MKILFLLSCLEPAGSETYCVALARAWGDRHRVSWISDRLHFGQPYLSLPISRKAFPGGLLNTVRVARFVREQGIELIHSHSRRAHWVAAQAAALTGIPHVTTIHQPPPVHLFSRLFPCLGDAAIAIDEAVRDHLIRQFHIPSERIHLIRNGIDIPSFLPGSSSPHLPTVLWLGRLSGGRWHAYQFFLDVLRRISATLPPAHYRIAGRVPEERRALIESQINELNTRISPARLELAGWLDPLTEAIDSADVVIGAGRSAMESLARGKPVIVLGERGVLGLAEESLWPRCLESNFGDHLGEKEFVPARLEWALRAALDPQRDRSTLARWGRSRVERDYAIGPAADAVSALYASVSSRGHG